MATVTGPLIGSLFSGAGMLDEGVRSVLGGQVAWHAEIDPAASRVLAHRYPTVPNLGDITAVDWAAVEPVDVITGGSPCQDVSHAGKRAGMRAGTRSGLWASMVDAIDIIRPALVVWENVRGVLSAEADSAMEPCAGCVGDGDGEPVLRALGRVLGDLAELGYDTRWCGLRAADVGAPHGRFRVFVAAWPVADAEYPERQRLRSGSRLSSGHAGQDLAAIADAEFVGSGSRRSASERASCDDSVAHADHDAARNGLETGLASGRWSEPAQRSGIDWVEYEPAIRRWEHVLGRVAPHPTSAGTRGGQQLSARFDEWLMGWPDGWVTDPAIWDGWKPSAARNAQIKLCGNGVVPQQAAEALRRLLATSAERAA